MKKNQATRHSIFLLAFSSALTAFFIWRFDIAYWKSGMMLIETILAGTIFIIALVKSVKNRFYLLSILPILILILFASGRAERIIHGGLAYSSYECDMGVCESLEIMNDGKINYSYYYQPYPEMGSTKIPLDSPRRKNLIDMIKNQQQLK